jgi:type IV pilus assembly protein PilQ
MKKEIIYLFLILLFPSMGFSSEMKAVNFTQKGEVSELEFLFDKADVKAAKFQVKEDKQIIVDFSDVKSTERVMRGFDASQFSGAIVYVKAYKKPKTENDIRIAIQMRDNVRSALVRQNNKIILQIENRYGVFSQSKIEENQTVKEKIADVGAADLKKINIPQSDSIEDILENITMSGRKKYVGKKISLNLKNIKPEEMLKMIAETSGFNIIVGEDVKKLESISLTLTDLPWDQILDTILEMNKLTAKKSGMILMISTNEVFAREMEIAKKTKESSKEQEPILTKVLPISFASIDDLMKILSEYSTERRGKISKDSRTNSLIIKDTNEVIDRMKKIVELLDAQTPQVLIESKIVEVNENYAKELGLAKGITAGYSLTGTPGNNGGSFSFSTAPSTGLNAFGLNVATFSRLTGLDFSLRLMESESKGKIISSPKVITKNNVAATINQTEERYYAETSLAPTSAATTSTSGGTTTTAPSTVLGYKPQTANLSLSVTPQVTNEGSISLDVSVTKDSFVETANVNQGSPFDTVKRNIKTQVLVDNGATVVIGGIYTYSTTESHSGIPFLKDIPMLGWLFRSHYNPKVDKKELIIFLTPRIINQEEAGLVDRG